jgi:hypothetical protein
MMDEDERKVATSRLVRIGGGFFGLGVLLTALICYVESKQTRVPPPPPAHTPTVAGGDTPIVLVGGTLTFKAGNKNNDWQANSTTGGYSVAPGYPVAKIVIKAMSAQDTSGDPVGDDSDQTTDELRFDVPTITPVVTSWEIDEFTSDSGTTAVASITPGSGNTINLQLKNPSGSSLCPDNPKKIRRLLYNNGPNCTGKNPDFTSVSLSVTAIINNVSQTLTLANLDCIDQNNNLGICRIVFRKQ